MTKPVFLIDVDDVLADFAHPAAELLSDTLGRQWTFADMVPGEWDMFVGLTESQRKKVDKAINDYGWLWTLKPYPGSQQAMQQIGELADIYIVTSAMSWAPVRIEWLRKHFGIDKEHQVYTKAKHLVRGDFFLDDNPTYVRQWQEHNPDGDSMLWTAPNNIHLDEPNIRVHDWPDVINRVRDLVEWPQV